MNTNPKNQFFAVIDTNVLVAAMLTRHSDSATVQVVELLFQKRLVPLFNKEILQEYAEVLHRAKFCLPEPLIDNFLISIQELGMELHRTATQEIFPDTKDIVFYEVALSKKDAFLVTGNKKHFPFSPIIVSPSELIEIINKALK